LKPLYTILIFITATIFACPVYSQDNKLKVCLETLPELKDLLKEQNVEIVLFNERNNLNFKITDTLVIDSIKEDSITFMIRCFVGSSPYSKRFNLTLENIKLIRNNTTHITVTFPLDCAYNKHALNNICPKCKKNDRVGPILYGLLIPIFGENGTIKPFPKNYESGGCIISDCDPSWYCQRDKLRF
jgi:hypothetical protein